jgi:hypothetical protein
MPGTEPDVTALEPDTFPEEPDITPPDPKEGRRGVRKLG